MFCLMDVSGSMTEHMKDLAKRFFMLLYIFLKRRYKHVDIVFIRHTHRGAGGRRGHVLPQPGDRRHRGLHRAGGDAARRARSAIAPTTGTSTPRRPRTATTTPSDNDAHGAAADRTRSCRSASTSPISRSARVRAFRARLHPPRTAICGRPTARSAAARRAAGDAQGRPSRARSSRCSTSCSRQQTAEQAAAREPTPMTSRAPTAAVRRRRVGLRHAPARPRRDRGDRARRARPRRLSQPDRGHQRRADARRLFLDRHAAVLQALVVRQAFRPQRGAATAQGMQGLAYEIVINSNPCISYIMEENTATMQTLVIAHAAFGHNHFFKNNYLFRQWTDADGILDYLEFAKRLHRQLRGTLRRGRGRATARRRARADDPRRPPLSAASRATDLRDRGKARARAPRARQSRCSTTCGAPCPARAPGRQRPRPPRSARRALLRPAAGEHPVFPGKDRAAPGSPGSASCCASCATSRSISIRRARPR